MVASRNDSDFCPISKLDGITGTGNCLVLKLNTDQFLRGSICLLVSDSLFTDELIFVKLAEHAEASHDRGYLRSQLVSVKRQSSLETEGVTATKTARRDSCGKESVPVPHDQTGSRINLEPILARVAGTADDHP